VLSADHCYINYIQAYDGTVVSVRKIYSNPHEDIGMWELDKPVYINKYPRFGIAVYWLPTFFYGTCPSEDYTKARVSYWVSHGMQKWTSRGKFYYRDKYITNDTMCRR